jgi:hypothetical protein
LARTRPKFQTDRTTWPRQQKNTFEKAQHCSLLKVSAADDLKRDLFEGLEGIYRLLAQSARLIAETGKIKGAHLETRPMRLWTERAIVPLASETKNRSKRGTKIPPQS